MKIAVWHNLPSGGGKRALYYHVRGLIERGHTLEAWCPPRSDLNYLPLSELIIEHVMPIQARDHDGVRNGILGEWHGDQLRSVKALDEHCRRCAEEIDRQHFDIVFANSSVIQAVAPIARYLRTKKVLYLQEPKRLLYEARENGLPWIAIPRTTTPWLRPRYLTWFVFNAVGMQQLRRL